MPSNEIRSVLSPERVGASGEAVPTARTNTRVKGRSSLQDQATGPARSAPIETTELRWFRNGPLPRSVCSWFTSNGAFGAVEERRDRYLMDGRLDRGLKLRDGSTLELKVRQTIARTVPSSDGPDAVAELPRGTVEQWQKWSPADHLVSTGSELWVEVHKRIVKRRFTIAGEEMTVLDHADTLVGAYCDIEIVVIDDGSAEKWSLAFAAHGPLHSRLAGIGAAWCALVSVARPPSRSLVFDVSCGYPEWLERRIGDTSAVTGR